MTPESTPIRRIVGCMTGTSLDGIDAALIEVVGRGASAMSCTFIRGFSDTLGNLAEPLRDLANQQPMTSGRIAELTREFALLHARVVATLLRGERADLISVHGQTVYHRPPVSWQLFEPATLAHACGTAVVCNLRQADLARGGQGAPITPAADGVIFMHATSSVDMVINLGGFCNVSLRSSAGDMTGFDVCACNHALDMVARERMRQPFDDGGRTALAGLADAGLTAALHAALSEQRRQQRSLGTGDELWSLLRERAASHTAPDVAASLCEALARTIRDAAPPRVRRVAVAGGGVRNAALMRALARQFDRCTTTDDLGVPASYREAACFAVLGALAQDGEDIYVRHDATQTARAAIAGSWAFVPGTHTMSHATVAP